MATVSTIPFSDKSARREFLSTSYLLSVCLTFSETFLPMILSISAIFMPLIMSLAANKEEHMLLCLHVHLTSDNNTAARTLARPLRYSGLLVKIVAGVPHGLALLFERAAKIHRAVIWRRNFTVRENEAKDRG